MKAIYFDMDGTIANLYAVDGWLYDLRNGIERPYAQAKTMVNMNLLARYLNALQEKGFKIGVISWLSKVSDNDYSKRVTAVKQKWLARHLKSVKFDEVKIVDYGTPKHEVVTFKGGILFDDEEQNRKNWRGQAYDEKNILNILKNLLKNA